MSLECPYCKSSDCVKRGKRRNKSGIKQRFICNDCEKQFVIDDGFKKMRHKPTIIVRAIHQHVDGMSLSKVKNHLWQHDNIKVTRWTISQWTKKYSNFLKYSALKSKSKG